MRVREWRFDDVHTALYRYIVVAAFYDKPRIHRYITLAIERCGVSKVCPACCRGPDRWYARQLDPRRNDGLLIPVNINNNHWVLLWVSREGNGGHVYLVDSMDTVTFEHPTINNFMKALEPAVEGAGMPSIKYYPHHVIRKDHAFQNSGVACGVFVINFMASILSAIPLREWAHCTLEVGNEENGTSCTQRMCVCVQDIDRMRQRIAYDILIRKKWVH